jgi:hypothetical protein
MGKSRAPLAPGGMKNVPPNWYLAPPTKASGPGLFKLTAITSAVPPPGWDR